ncbi:MAG: glycoside hydrolase family 10 protein [Blastocatellales bacterium]
MKRGTGIIVCYLLLLLTALLPAQKTAAPVVSLSLPQPFSNLITPVSTPTPEPSYGFESRALWVVRHTLTSPEAVRELVARTKENGFTDLVVQIRGRGDAWYASNLEPRAEELGTQPGQFDPLAQVIDQAHLVGIRVHAWINMYLVANLDPLPRNRGHLIYRHPEWIMVPKAISKELYGTDPADPGYLSQIVEHSKQQRTELEGLYTSPAHPQVKDNIFEIWMDVARNYEVDGLHFDYVRYPNPQFDYSRVSLDRFRAMIEKDLDTENRDFLAKEFEKDPLIYATSFPEKYAQFQRDQVTDLVGRIYKGVKRIRSNALVSAAVFANETEASRSRYQDWKLWLSRGWLDILCPMAYTTETESFRRQISSAIANSAGRRVWGGIGAWRQTADQTIEKINVARELGAQGFILFSYDSSIQASPLNPQADYLKRVHEALKSGSQQIRSQ